MDIIFIYFLPMIICLVLFSFWTIKKIRRDIRWDHCVTFGTVLFGLLGLAVSFLPVANLIGGIVILVITACAYEDEISDLMSTPLCDWFPQLRRKENQ